MRNSWNKTIGIDMSNLIHNRVYHGGVEVSFFSEKMVETEGSSNVKPNKWETIWISEDGYTIWAGFVKHGRDPKIVVIFRRETDGPPVDLKIPYFWTQMFLWISPIAIVSSCKYNRIYTIKPGEHPWAHLRFGRPSITIYRPGDPGDPGTSGGTLRGRGVALTMRCIRIVTGRKHQIRVHSAHIGHPVAWLGETQHETVRLKLTLDQEFHAKVYGKKWAYDGVCIYIYMYTIYYIHTYYIDMILASSKKYVFAGVSIILTLVSGLS